MYMYFLNFYEHFSEVIFWFVKSIYFENLRKKNSIKKIAHLDERFYSVNLKFYN